MSIACGMLLATGSGMTATPDHDGRSAAVGATALAAAFETFNAVSRELESSYRTLEREAARLRRELRGANEHRAEESRRHASLAERLSALLEALPGGVLLIDGAGRVQEANSTASALLGGPVHGETWESIRERAGFAQGATHAELALADGR